MTLVPSHSRRGSSLFGVAAVLALLVWASPGAAIPLEYAFSGQVVTSLDSSILVGEAYSGVLRYDSNASLAAIGGNYKTYTDATLEVELTFDTVLLTFTGGSMSVSDPAPQANFGIAVFDSVTTSGTTENYSIVNLDFGAAAGTFAPNFDIPTDLTVLTAFNGSSRDFVGGVTRLTFSVGGVTLVPEPSTVLLFAPALATLAVHRRRRR